MGATPPRWPLLKDLHGDSGLLDRTRYERQRMGKQYKEGNNRSTSRSASQLGCCLLKEPTLGRCHGGQERGTRFPMPQIPTFQITAWSVSDAQNSTNVSTHCEWRGSHDISRVELLRPSIEIDRRYHPQASASLRASQCSRISSESPPRAPYPSPSQRDCPSLPRACQTAVDLLTISLGNVATMVVVNFNATHGKPSFSFPVSHRLQLADSCPSPKKSPQWLLITPLIHHLPQSFRCPSVPVACLAFAIYSMLGILHLPWAPRYWPDFGLLAIGISLGTGMLLGLDAMTQALTIGGFLSFVLAKCAEWLAVNSRCGCTRGQLTCGSTRDRRWTAMEKC